MTFDDKCSISTLSETEFLRLLRDALDARTPLLRRLGEEGTDCVRLFHGATEGCPGVAVDRYGPVVLVQTWRDPISPARLDRIRDVVAEALAVELVLVWNHRARGSGDYEAWFPSPTREPAMGREGGLRYDVTPRHRGRDPLLFLDFRVGRRWIRENVEGKSVLNLFAYTCGIGLAAAAGGAAEVWNVDFARSALEVGRANAQRNGLAAPQRFVHQDVFPVVRQLAALRVGRPRGRRVGFQRFTPRTFDRVVLDPPRWAVGPFGAVDVVRDYASLFKPALLATAPGGRILATNNVASVALDEWMHGLVRCANKAGRPLRDVHVLRPDEDFPSPDRRFPLKMVVATV